MTVKYEDLCTKQVHYVALKTREGIFKENRLSRITAKVHSTHRYTNKTKTATATYTTFAEVSLVVSLIASPVKSRVKLY